MDREQLNEEITYEEFLKELDDFKAWTSKVPRRRGSWYMSVVDYFEGRR